MNNIKNKTETEQGINKSGSEKARFSSLSLANFFMILLWYEIAKLAVLPLQRFLLIYISGMFIGSCFYIYFYLSGEDLFAKRTTKITSKEWKLFWVSQLLIVYPSLLWPIVVGYLTGIDLLDENMVFLASIISTMLLLELLNRQIQKR